MVHAFSFDGLNIGFDHESGSLHVFDDISFDILKEYIKTDGTRPDEAVLHEISEKYSVEPDSPCEAIEQLIREGSLFSEPVQLEVSDFYPDKPFVKAMCLHICHECNLRCGYCFASGGDYQTGERGFISFETGKKAIDFLIENSGSRKNIDIDFFGGEPLLNWETVKLLTEYCEKTGPEKNKVIRLTLTTNAMNLDDEKTDFINLHMDNCVLSLDGRPEVNDRMRPDKKGNGSYESVSENIRRFIRSGRKKPYFVRGTYTKLNKDFSADVMHIVSLGASNVSVEPVVGPDDSFYAITENDLEELYREYDKLAREYYFARKNNEPFEFFHFHIDLEKGPCSYKRLKGCGVGNEYIAVTPSGDIYPCHQFVGEEKFRMGNVFENNEQYFEKVRSMFSNLLVPQKTECSKCWAKFFCSGGCPANAYHATGSIHGIYETGCKLQIKRLECALWIKAREALDKAK